MDQVDLACFDVHLHLDGLDPEAVSRGDHALAMGRIVAISDNGVALLPPDCILDHVKIGDSPVGTLGEMPTGR